MTAWMALAGNRDAFFILIIVSVITDLVDGPIARWSGQDSPSGARLDTIADGCTVLAGILGLYLFEGHNLRPEFPWLLLFLASYAAAALLCLAKFGKLPAYHLYLSKIANFSAGAFMVWLYLAGYSREVFLGVVILGVLANLESLITTLRLKRLRADIGSIFLPGAGDRGDSG